MKAPISKSQISTRRKMVWMVEPTCVLIKQLKDKGREIKFLRMDNAGGNQILEARCKSKDWQFVMDFEYTARATPQHNHMAELGFATLGKKEEH
jgi:hypothetical protein